MIIMDFYMPIKIALESNKMILEKIDISDKKKRSYG